MYIFSEQTNKREKRSSSSDLIHWFFILTLSLHYMQFTLHWIHLYLETIFPLFQTEVEKRSFLSGDDDFFSSVVESGVTSWLVNVSSSKFSLNMQFMAAEMIETKVACPTLYYFIVVRWHHYLVLVQPCGWYILLFLNIPRAGENHLQLNNALE